MLNDLYPTVTEDIESSPSRRATSQNLKRIWKSTLDGDGCMPLYGKVLPTVFRWQGNNVNTEALAIDIKWDIVQSFQKFLTGGGFRRFI